MNIRKTILLAACTLPCLCSCNRDMENMQTVYLEAQANRAQRLEHVVMRRALYKACSFSLKPHANVYYDGEFYYVVDVFLGTPRNAWEIRRRGRRVTPQKYAEFCAGKSQTNSTHPINP